MGNVRKTYGKPMENLWKCMDVYGNVWKKLPKKISCPAAFFLAIFSVFCCMENVTKENLWKIYRKSIKIYGNLWKCMEMYKNVRKIYGNVLKIYGTVWE